MGLSIDPKLFQAKTASDDRLATARPGVDNVPKGHTSKDHTGTAAGAGAMPGDAVGKGGKGAEDKKKVSHARKVGRVLRCYR